MLIEDELVVTTSDVAAKGSGRPALNWGASSIRLTALDVIAASVALALCVAYGSFFLIPSWTPRMMVLIAIAPLGAVLLGRQALRRDRIALVLCALLGWSVIAAMLASDPMGSILGRVGTEESVLILVAAFGLLAMARELSDRGRVTVAWAVLGGVTLSSLMGVLQYVAQTTGGAFALTAGRASGLTSNPVYFGACAAAAFGILVGRKSSASARVFWVEIAMAVLFGLAISLSASRVALGAAIVVGLSQIVLQRSGRTLGVAFAGVMGVALGTLLTTRMGSGLNSVNRVTDGGGDRKQMWAYGLDALRDRPIPGWGFGQFRAVAQGRMTVEHERMLGAGSPNGVFDAHNLIVGIGVSLGVVGLVAVGVLTALFVRRARGPLAVGALALALSWLLQPMGLATFPLAMLLIGAALPAVGAGLITGDGAPPEQRSAGTSVSNARMLLLVPGVLAALFVGGVDVASRQLFVQKDSAALASLVEMLPADAVLADIVAQSYALDARAGDPDAGAKAIEWAERAADAQPDRSKWFTTLAVAEGRFGTVDRAGDAVDAALALEPNSWVGVELQMEVMSLEGDTDGMADLMPLACDLGVPSCDE